MRDSSSCRTTNVSNSEGLYAGVYDVNRRRAEVLSKLHASFAAICAMDLRNDEKSESALGWLVGPGRGRGRRKSTEDVVVMSLQKLESDISDLEKQAGEYTGPHFTRAYRTLQGYCSKLQTDLDALDVSGRDNVRKERKNQLMRIDKLAKDLASRAHPDGKSCDECEVKD